MTGLIVEPMTDAEALSDAGLLAGARTGDEASFQALVDRHHRALLRFSQIWVGEGPAAGEIVEEAWRRALTGSGELLGHPSLRVALLSIVARIAGVDADEGPVIDLRDSDPPAPAVDPARFAPAGAERWAGHWTSPPAAWGHGGAVLTAARPVLRAALGRLPLAERVVVGLRDIDGLAAGEVCTVLGVTDKEQAALLHQARSQVRRALEAHLAPGEVQP